MLLSVAVVPPAPVIEEVLDVVRPWSARPEEFRAVPRELLRVPLVSFGNPSLAETERLARAVSRVAAVADPMTLRLAGAAALEWPGDLSVWARLEGDVDALAHVARAIPIEVQRLGFFVDRRLFRPWMALGDITERTSPELLQDVYDAVDAHRGEEWTVEHLCLMKKGFRASDGGPGRLEVVNRFPLASAEPLAGRAVVRELFPVQGVRAG